MEEMEVPTEHLQEKIHEEAEEKKDQWAMYVALSTAFIAVLAAIAGLLSNHHANEALIEEVKASDQWNFYQAKSIKSEVAASTAVILQSLPPSPNKPSLKDEVARYEKEKEGIKTKAEEAEKDSENHLQIHLTLSKAVTIFQIAIAISAIAILTKKRIMWYGGLLLTLIGTVFLFLGILH